MGRGSIVPLFVIELTHLCTQVHVSIVVPSGPSWETQAASSAAVLVLAAEGTLDYRGPGDAEKVRGVVADVPQVLLFWGKPQISSRSSG